MFILFGVGGYRGNVTFKADFDPTRRSKSYLLAQAALRAPLKVAFAMRSWPLLLPSFSLLAQAACVRLACAMRSLAIVITIVQSFFLSLSLSLSFSLCLLLLTFFG